MISTSILSLLSYCCSLFKFQRDTIQAASSFALRNQLPPRLQDQMLAHLCLKYRTNSEGLQQQEILESLPKAIRSSISHYLFYSLVDKVYLFRGVSNDLLFQLVLAHNSSVDFHFAHNNFDWLSVVARFLKSFLCCPFYFGKVSEMKAEYFPPKEDVILQNEAPTDFYILVTGAVVMNQNLSFHQKFDVQTLILRFMASFGNRIPLLETELF